MTSTNLVSHCFGLAGFRTADLQHKKPALNRISHHIRWQHYTGATSWYPSWYDHGLDIAGWVSEGVWGSPSLQSKNMTAKGMIISDDRGSKMANHHDFTMSVNICYLWPLETSVILFTSLHFKVIISHINHDCLTQMTPASRKAIYSIWLEWAIITLSK